MTHFWNNHHQICSNRKIGKPNNLKKKVFGSNKTKVPKQDSQNSTKVINLFIFKLLECKNNKSTEHPSLKIQSCESKNLDSTKSTKTKNETKPHGPSSS